MLFYMFPGQGSQFQGMGKELFEKYRNEVILANEILGYDIVNVCLNNPNNQLNSTYYTQPLLFIVSALTFLDEEQRPNYVLGHSLGLYTALFAAKVFSFAQGIEIVKQRATLMAQADSGAMIAVIGDKISKIEGLLASEGFYDIDMANYNSDYQWVLSGHGQRLAELKLFLEGNNFRVINLPVNGAFHSRYMKEASVNFFNYLTGIVFDKFSIPVISTTNGRMLSNTHLLEELVYQLTKPVRWQQVISLLKKNFHKCAFKEIGPGNVLTRLNQQIQ
jgi:malonyl CoA-acyl carrier protein transacylase